MGGLRHEETLGPGRAGATTPTGAPRSRLGRTGGSRWAHFGTRRSPTCACSRRSCNNFSADGTMSEGTLSLSTLLRIACALYKARVVSAFRGRCSIAYVWHLVLILVNWTIPVWHCLRTPMHD